jgi:hypothetical protein
MNFRYKVLLELSVFQYQTCINISDIIMTSTFLIISNHVNFLIFLIFLWTFLNYFQCQCIGVLSVWCSVFVHHSRQCMKKYMILIVNTTLTRRGYRTYFRSEITVLSKVSMSTTRNRISCNSPSSNIKLVWPRLF